MEADIKKVMGFFLGFFVIRMRGVWHEKKGAHSIGNCYGADFNNQPPHSFAENFSFQPIQFRCFYSDRRDRLGLDNLLNSIMGG